MTMDPSIEHTRIEENVEFVEQIIDLPEHRLGMGDVRENLSNSLR